MAKSGPGSALKFAQIMKIVHFLREHGVPCRGDEGFRSIAKKVCEWTGFPIVTSKGKIREVFREFLIRPEVHKFKAPTYANIVEIAGIKRAARSQKKVKRSAASKTNFYFSPEWRRVRYEALKRSRGVCELCGAAPSLGKPLHVDHIKPRSKYPDLEFDITNLQILCDDCNLGKGNTDEIDWRRAG